MIFSDIDAVLSGSFDLKQANEDNTMAMAPQCLMNYKSIFGLNIQNVANRKPLLELRANSGIIICGLRSSPRKGLWRSRVLSKEAIQVVHSLKLAKSSPKIQHLLDSRLSRLIKFDVLDVLAELHRQNELDLCLQVPLLLL